MPIALVELVIEFSRLRLIQGATGVVVGTGGESTTPRFHRATSRRNRRFSGAITNLRITTSPSNQDDPRGWDPQPGKPETARRCRRDCHLSLQDDGFPRRDDRNGRLGGQFDGGVVGIACRGVKVAGKFLSLRPLWRGLGGRRWHGRRELDRGYAPVASLDNSTIIFLFRYPRLSSFQTLAARASFG